MRGINRDYKPQSQASRIVINKGRQYNYAKGTAPDQKGQILVFRLYKQFLYDTCSNICKFPLKFASLHSSLIASPAKPRLYMWRFVSYTFRTAVLGNFDCTMAPSSDLQYDMLLACFFRIGHNKIKTNHIKKSWQTDGIIIILITYHCQP